MRPYVHRRECIRRGSYHHPYDEQVDGAPTDHGQKMSASWVVFIRCQREWINMLTDVVDTLGSFVCELAHNIVSPKKCIANRIWFQ